MRSLASLMLAALIPFGAANAATVTQTTDVVDSATRQTVLGTATLTREDNLLRIRFNTTGLVEGHAYVLIAFLFQDPSYCAADPCDFPSDSGALGGNPAVNTTTMLISGGTAFAGSGGAVTFAGKVEKGTAGLTGHQILEVGGGGFYNMFGGDVQVLLRDMGVSGGNGVDPFDQVSDYLAGCDQNTCKAVQIATFNAH